MEHTPSISFREFGQESPSSRTCGKSQNENQFFLPPLPIPVAGPGLQTSGLLNVFPAKNCFHVCTLIAKSGSLLTMSFLHHVQEPFIFFGRILRFLLMETNAPFALIDLLVSVSQIFGRKYPIGSAWPKSLPSSNQLSPAGTSLCGTTAKSRAGRRCGR